MSEPDHRSTAGAHYAERLRRIEGARWKRLIDAQAPYRWNVRRLDLGHTLDVGCGIGRNLGHLGGNGVGVDHNATSVQIARERGLRAYTVEEFLASEHARPDTFDSMLAAHLVEHLSEPQAREVVGAYLPYVRPGGKVVFITPQESGYASDATHVRFVGFAELDRLATDLGLAMQRRYSFPFPRWAGKVFKYNEFVAVARRPG
jgi:2-polyprenyl-3-methyl-5-hydroxy-6-metoxy-1,4-benzoquinol methylase